KLTQWDLCRTSEPLQAYPNVLDCFGIGAVTGRESHHNWKMPVASRLIHFASTVTSNRNLDRCVDVTRRKAISRRAITVDINLHRGLAERREYGEVSDSRNGREHCLDLIRCVGKYLKIGTIELY